MRDWEGEARERDGQDTLASFRSEFYLRPGEIYLEGNSLGLLSRPAEEAVLRALEEWKRFGVNGWKSAATPWFSLAEELAQKTAPLIGAEPEAVIVTNSTTVNLHQLLATLFQPKAGQRKMLADALNFPSDLYAMESHLRLRGLIPERELLLVSSADGLTLDEDEIVEKMAGEAQLAILPGVLYVSGQLLDMARLTAAAHARGILIGFDLSHAIGAIPLALDDWDVDFAFWCSYKYLNGGPGATGGLYLNRRHFSNAPGLAGWWGSRKETQFSMTRAFQPAIGAGALQIGTPNILSMAALAGSLEMFARAGMERIRRKSLQQTGFLMAFVEEELRGQDVIIGNPREEARRGGHVALMHEAAIPISHALREAGVHPDFRPPNMIRMAPVALYTSFRDCLDAMQRLKKVINEGTYRRFSAERDIVP